MVFSNKPIPVGLHVNSAAGYCRLLVNNEWHEVTKLIFCSLNCQGHIDPLMMKEGLERIEQEVPGTVDWFNWGPRLN